MLIATIRKPSTAIEVVIVRLLATLSASLDVLDLRADVVAGRGEGVLEPCGCPVDERVIARGRADPVVVGAGGRGAEHDPHRLPRDEEHGAVLLLVGGDADHAQRQRAAAGLDLDAVADLCAGAAGEVALDHGHAGALPLLGRRVPPSVGDPVVEHGRAAGPPR